MRSGRGMGKTCEQLGFFGYLALRNLGVLAVKLGAGVFEVFFGEFVQIGYFTGSIAGCTQMVENLEMAEN